MILLTSILTEALPPDWVLKKNENKLIIRDANTDQGKGFKIILNKEPRYIHAIIEFEDYAKQLMDYADKILQEENLIIKNIFDAKSNLSGKIYRQQVEKIFEPQTREPKAWWITLEYKRGLDEKQDIITFVDSMICFVFFLLPYKTEGVIEGHKYLESVYERSPINRKICLAFHGYRCKICDINLKETYSSINHESIHVHHLNLISKNGVSIPDPIKDMVPLCPNCHHIIHLRTPQYSLEEVRTMLKKL
jgi:hypothetical protein